MNAIHDVLTDLRMLFDQHGIGWYVFGAQAVVVYGQPRQTADVDLTIDVSPDAVSSLAPPLRAAGFTILVNDLETFALRTRVIPVVHISSGIPVDMIIAGPGIEQEFLLRAQHIDIGETRIPFISSEDLVATKILAGRPKDLEDVRGILERQGASLDDRRVRDVLTRFEQALDRSDLVYIFDSLRRP